MTRSPTRTRLRLGLVKSRRVPAEGGVTSEELDVLLADEPEVERKTGVKKARGSRKRKGRSGKKLSIPAM